MSELIGLEARFLDNHIQLISSAITGRATQGDTGQAAGLSDVERALILARASNAEALLQVELQADEHAKRYFAEDDDGKLEAVVPPLPYKSGVVLTESRYRLLARVIDVQTGAIVLLINVTQNTTNAEGFERKVRVKRVGGGGDVVSLSTADKELQNEAVDQILKVVAERMRLNVSPSDQRCRPHSDS